MTRKARGATPKPPAHPGKALREAIKATGLTQSDFAARVLYSYQYVNDVCNGRRDVSTSLAVAIEKFPGFPKAEVWLTMQMHYDLWRLRG